MMRAHTAKTLAVATALLAGLALAAPAQAQHGDWRHEGGGGGWHGGGWGHGGFAPHAGGNGWGGNVDFTAAPARVP